MEVNWYQTRRIILNDRVVGYKPDRAFLDNLAALLPDVRVIGFGKYYEYHWYVVIESKYFPDSINPLESSYPATSLFKELLCK